MYRIRLILVVIVAAFALTACDENHHVPPPVDLRPALEAFHMVDSYGVSTEDYYYPELTLDPYLYNGLFELYWYADSHRDYYAEFYVNYRPSINGALFIDEVYCGPGLPCDRYGSQICRYTEDFTLSCNPNTPEVDISHYFFTLPEKLYLILQICDTGSYYCEYQYHPVWME